MSLSTKNRLEILQTFTMFHNKVGWKKKKQHNFQSLCLVIHCVGRFDIDRSPYKQSPLFLQ